MLTIIPVYVPDDLEAIDSQIHIHLSSCQENLIMAQDYSDSNSEGLEDVVSKNIFSRRRTVISVAFSAGPCIIYMKDRSLCISCAGSCAQSAVLCRGCHSDLQHTCMSNIQSWPSDGSCDFLGLAATSLRCGAAVIFVEHGGDHHRQHDGPPIYSMRRTVTESRNNPIVVPSESHGTKLAGIFQSVSAVPKFLSISVN